MRFIRMEGSLRFNNYNHINFYNMKVQIEIRFNWESASGIHNEYSGCSEVIEWNLPLPVRGDIIFLAEEQNSIKMKYDSVEAKRFIEWNTFEYKIKQYYYKNGEVVIRLMFGDWNF